MRESTIDHRNLVVSRFRGAKQVCFSALSRLALTGPSARVSPRATARLIQILAIFLSSESSPVRGSLAPRAHITAATLSRANLPPSPPRSATSIQAANSMTRLLDSGTFGSSGAMQPRNGRRVAPRVPKWRPQRFGNSHTGARKLSQKSKHGSWQISRCATGSPWEWRCLFLS